MLRARWQARPGRRVRTETTDRKSGKGVPLFERSGQSSEANASATEPTICGLGLSLTSPFWRRSRWDL